MGCDYYIIKQIQIHYKNDNTGFVPIEVSRDRGYFYYSNLDEDEEDYEYECRISKEKQLTPEMNPILLYENGKFIKDTYNTKYIRMIEEANRIYRRNMTDVLYIYKDEVRETRE